jgi:hypothetical protein
MVPQAANCKVRTTLGSPDAARLRQRKAQRPPPDRQSLLKRAVPRGPSDTARHRPHVAREVLVLDLTARPERICSLATKGTVLEAVNALANCVRMPSDGLQDDVAVVLVSA